MRDYGIPTGGDHPFEIDLVSYRPDAQSALAMVEQDALRICAALRNPRSIEAIAGTGDEPIDRETVQWLLQIFAQDLAGIAMFARTGAANELGGLHYRPAAPLN